MTDAHRVQAGRPRRAVRRLAVLVGILASSGGPAVAAADAVAFWNETAITTSAVHLGRSPAASLVDPAYVHAAIYDVVVALRGGYRPFAVAIDNAPANASLEAAIAAAAHRVLLTMFPGDQAYIDGRYASALGSIADGQPKTDGIAVGEQVAMGLLAARSGDGWNAFVPYAPSSGPGAWQPTPPAFAPAIAPWMAVMRPFTFDSAARFRVDPPAALDSAQWAEDYNEVRSIGSLTSATRTPHQTEIARFYGEHTGIQYARVFRDLATEKSLSLEDSARLLAMLYVTSADALIGCWDSKFYYSFWRPVTAIRAGDTDGNSLTPGDSFWMPLLATPAHPEYPAAHGCFTSAIAESFAAFFGTKKVTITLTSTIAGTVPHTFTSTDDMVHEITDARVYGGIHYRTSVVRGVVLGRRVAHWVAKHYFGLAE
jgi:hypothetical protein